MNSQAKRIAALFVIFSTLTLCARVSINLSLNRSVYMRFEHIYACVTLRNDSGRPLLFGSDPALQGFLLFEIRDSFNRPVNQRKDADISVTGLHLAPGEVRRVIFRLNQHYQLDRCSKYYVHAYISHNELKNEFRSRDVSFEISNGSKVWTRTVGLPDLSEEKKQQFPEERTYSIYTLPDKESIGYYLTVEDSRKIYGVSRIGHVVGYEKFQVEIDMLSRLHLLMPVSPKVFQYLAFDAAGDNLENSYWKSSSTVPTLYRNSKTGVVHRSGGIPARPGVDFRAGDRNKISASELLKASGRKPAGRRNSGIVDLGQGAIADSPGSRERE